MEQYEYRRSVGLTPGHQLRLLRRRPPEARRRRPVGPPLWPTGEFVGGHEYDPVVVEFIRVPHRRAFPGIGVCWFSAEPGDLSHNLHAWVRLRRREAATRTMYRFTPSRRWERRHYPTIYEDCGDDYEISEE